MTRKKVKLAWVVNENSRTLSLKKRRLGLVKKVRELTILCDVKACMIMFSPNEVEPMVWPSLEATRSLLDNFFALPDIEKRKKETSLESYLKEKTRKVHEQLKNVHKKNMKCVVDQLMVQLQGGRKIADLNLSEIHALLSFSKDQIMLCRKRLDFVNHPPLREPPMYLFEAQSENLMASRNDVFLGEMARRANEASKRISIDTLRENQSHYLMDRWFFPSFESPTPRIHQQIGMDMVYYNENPNPISYLPYQGSSSNGNPNLEMEPVGHQGMMSFTNLVRSVSQPLQDYNMNNNSIMAMSQPRQYPFDFMSRELGVKEEGSNINNGDSQFGRSNNTIGLRQEPPPNGTTEEEGNVDATSFDINMVWPRVNNHHF